MWKGILTMIHNSNIFKFALVRYNKEIENREFLVSDGTFTTIIDKAMYFEDHDSLIKFLFYNPQYRDFDKVEVKISYEYWGTI